MYERRFYKPDEELIDKIQSQYSIVLDQVGLNVADPVGANVGFFNNTGKLFVDPMKLGKTVIFFTRPNLNFFSKRNIIRSRIFSYYRNNPMGVAIMRQLMYPDIAERICYAIYDDLGNKMPIVGRCDDSIIGEEKMIEGIHSLPLVKTNFMTLLSNTCTSTSNGKDLVLENFMTEGNFSGDRLQYAGGLDSILSIGNLSCTFEDIDRSPIMMVFFIWIMYMHYISKAICDPHWEYIVRRIIDYTCSIYIFMLAPDCQTILRWVRYGGCFPMNIPFGAIQHTKDTNSDSLRELSIDFGYNFMCAMDPLVLTEFNMISGPSIRYRLLTQYGDSDGKLTNELIKYHALSLDNAIRLLEEYPPKYERVFGSRSLPLKRVEYVDGTHFSEEYAQYSHHEGYSDNPLLKNRVNGLIENNFYGVPYIAEGNKLMFI
jgi:hypothetical protein